MVPHFFCRDLLELYGHVEQTPNRDEHLRTIRFAVAGFITLRVLT
jgi:hypothetical protein